MHDSARVRNRGRGKSASIRTVTTIAASRLVYPVWCRILHIRSNRSKLIPHQRECREGTEMHRLTPAFPDRVGRKSGIEADDVKPRSPQHDEEGDIGPESVTVRYRVVLCEGREVSWWSVSTVFR
jgi:hypothetical protein